MHRRVPAGRLALTATGACSARAVDDLRRDRSRSCSSARRSSTVTTSNALAADHTDTRRGAQPHLPARAGRREHPGLVSRALHDVPRLAHHLRGADHRRRSRRAPVHRAGHARRASSWAWPGTGRKFQIVGALLYRFDDGLIAEERRIYDFTGLLMQVGCSRGSRGEGDGWDVIAMQNDVVKC